MFDGHHKRQGEQDSKALMKQLASTLLQWYNITLEYYQYYYDTS